MRRVRAGMILALLAALLAGCARRRPPEMAPAPEEGISRKAFEQTLRSYLGVPYKSGGTTPRGFDCSGYVQSVYRKYGFKLPRTVAKQYECGWRISRRRLKFGDLVFFSAPHKRKGHVGVYLGEGIFIHASSSKGVTITELEDGYFGPRFIGGRRIVEEFDP